MPSTRDLLSPFRFAPIAVLAIIFGLAGDAALAAQDQQPESGSGRQAKTSVAAENFMLSTANPYATRAGYEVLKAGGNAIDAAVAVQTMLNLVEPQSSGIGGGSFLLYWDAKTRQLVTFDGRETAPAAAAPDYFLKPDGTPKGFWEAVVGGRSGRGAGHPEAAGRSPSGIRPSGLGLAAAAGDQARRRGLRRIAAPGPVDRRRQGKGPCPFRGDPSLLLQSRRQPQGSGHAPRQPGIRRGAQTDRPGRRQGPLSGTHRRRDRRCGPLHGLQSRHPDAGRSGGL